MRIDMVTHAGVGIGYGHLTRTMALAEALVERGGAVRFILPDIGGAEALSEAGFQWHILPGEAWMHPWGKAPSLYVMDHYRVNPAYFKGFSDRAPVAYIDDLLGGVFPVAAIINGHFYGESLGYDSAYPHAIKILGPQHCLLRKPFRSLPRRRQGKVTDILLTTGGTDPQGLMPKLMAEALQAIGDQGVRIHCIIGAGYPESSEYQSLALADPRFRLHWHPAHLGNIMEACQVAVTAAGTTLYELAAYGVPALAWQMVDNQRYVFQSAAEQGLIIPTNPALKGDLAGKLEALLEDEDQRAALSSRLQSMVDGQGAQRVADRLMRLINEKE